MFKESYVDVLLFHAGLSTIQLLNHAQSKLKGRKLCSKCNKHVELVRKSPLGKE